METGSVAHEDTVALSVAKSSKFDVTVSVRALDSSRLNSCIGADVLALIRHQRPIVKPEYVQSERLCRQFVPSSCASLSRPPDERDAMCAVSPLNPVSVKNFIVPLGPIYASGENRLVRERIARRRVRSPATIRSAFQ